MLFSLPVMAQCGDRTAITTFALEFTTSFYFTGYGWSWLALLYLVASGDLARTTVSSRALAVCRTPRFQYFCLAQQGDGWRPSKSATQDLHQVLFGFPLVHKFTRLKALASITVQRGAPAFSYVPHSARTTAQHRPWATSPPQPYGELNTFDLQCCSWRLLFKVRECNGKMHKSC